MADINDLTQAREADRQQFVEEAWRLVLEEMEETHEAVAGRFVMARLFMDYLMKRAQVVLPQPRHETTCEQVLRRFFDQRLLPQIEGFARTSQEKDDMVATLADQVFQALTRSSHHDLIHQHIHEPQKLYRDAARRD